MPAESLKKFLDDNQVKYVAIAHSPAYTTSEVAQAAHVPGREMAKTVMVKLDGKLVMAVVRGTDTVDFDLLRNASGAGEADLASESEFAGEFANIEPGAMPPFGNLYDMAVYVDEALREDAQIAFNAGTHRELIRMAYADFERLAQPRVARFAK